MYEFEDGSRKRVRNTITGERNICPGSWKWDEYRRWVNGGGMTNDFKVDKTDEIERDVASVIADLESAMHEDVMVDGELIRATPMERSRLAGMLAMASLGLLPNSEIMMSNGKVKAVGRDELQKIITAILARDNELLKSAVDSVATARKAK